MEKNNLVVKKISLCTNKELAFNFFKVVPVTSSKKFVLQV